MQDVSQKDQPAAGAKPIPAAPPCAMVIFGAGGDLTKRLVVPSLYELAREGRLSSQFQLVGVDLVSMTAADWASGLRKMMDELVAQSGGEFHVGRIDETEWRWLTDRMTYLQGDLNDAALYRRLGEHLAG